MGYAGLLKSEIFSSPLAKKTLHDISDIKIPLTERKYEKSGLSEETAEQYKDALLQIMETQKPYKQNDLTLSQLAEILNISPHNLSEVINSQLHKSFYDLINEYRINEVKKDLVDPSKNHLKILFIAFDAGCNSKASFNTIFKEKVGTTPSEFRNKNTD